MAIDVVFQSYEVKRGLVPFPNMDTHLVGICLLVIAGKVIEFIIGGGWGAALSVNISMLFL